MLHELIFHLAPFAFALAISVDAFVLYMSACPASERMRVPSYEPPNIGK